MSIRPKIRPLPLNSFYSLVSSPYPPPSTFTLFFPRLFLAFALLDYFHQLTVVHHGIPKQAYLNQLELMVTLRLVNRQAYFINLHQESLHIRKGSEFATVLVDNLDVVAPGTPRNSINLVHHQHRQAQYPQQNVDLVTI